MLKDQKSHGNSRKSHAKTAFFLHKVNPGHALHRAVPGVCMAQFLVLTFDITRDLRLLTYDF